MQNERNLQTVIIADDDEFFRMALSAILKQRLGFAEVIETASFDEAILRLENAGKIALALFDLSMPGLDSPAALSMVHTSFDVERMAVVSASRRRSDILLSLEAGAHGYISKAQGPDGLQSAIEQILLGTICVPWDLTTLNSVDPADKNLGDAENPPRSAAKNEEARLTQCQNDVLEMLKDGRTIKEIASHLNLGPVAVKVHIEALYRHLSASDTIHLFPEISRENVWRRA